jgi:hypothetical protein
MPPDKVTNAEPWIEPMTPGRRAAVWVAVVAATFVFFVGLATIVGWAGWL